MLRRATTCLAVLAALTSAEALAAPPTLDSKQLSELAALPKLRGPAPLMFLPNALRPAVAEVPLILHLGHAPSAAEVAKLAATGVRIRRRSNGSLPLRDLRMTVRASASALRALASLDVVDRIELDGSPLPSPPPLIETGAEIGAPGVWATTSPVDDQFLTGVGMTVCDLDSGIDVLHPSFFRADAGYYDWVDVDENGLFDRDVDGVVIDGYVFVLRVLDGQIFGPSGPDPILDSSDPELDIAFDWLYADWDADGVRSAGRAAGYDDSVPAFGEPLFVVDDVNANGKLDRGEKLVRLGSSKIKSVWYEDETYTRGTNLIDVPPSDAGHGDGASGIMVAGNRGLGRHVVGIAPDADLAMAVRGTDLYALTEWCLDQEARVVLHEYAPWQGYPLDGSSSLEALIDKTSAQGVAHINPAGNLSGAQKLYKRSHPAGETTTIDFTLPSNGYHFLGLTLLWRDTRALAIELEDSTGHMDTLRQTPGQEQVDWHDGLYAYSLRETSARGTQRVDAYVYSMSGNLPMPEGDWKLHVTDPATSADPPIEVIGYIEDDISGWAVGAHFTDFVSEDHLIGHPGTADHGIAVAAYTGHGYWGGVPGQRADYSGRGYRIDGVDILSISGPDDPISPGYREDLANTYFTFGGTSGASPHVAGAAALMLQAHPDWTGDDVRQAVRDGALADDAVGQVPNHDFGYGKLRVYRSLYGSDPPAGSPPDLVVEPVEVELGIASTLPYHVDDADLPNDALLVEVDRDYDGIYDEQVTGDEIEVVYDELGEHIVKLRVSDQTGRSDQALAFITVVPRKPDSVASALIPSGGLACAVGPIRRARSEPSWTLWLLAALAVSLRRRRARGTRRWCGPSPRRG